MPKICWFVFFVLLAISANAQNQNEPLLTTKKKQTPPAEITKIADNVYVHTTFQFIGKTKFPSNGLIIDTKEGVVLVDTGWGEEQTEQVLTWVQQNLRKRVTYCLATHAHADRLGGIKILQKQNVIVATSTQTAAKAVAEGYPMPDLTFKNDTTFTFGNVTLQTFYPGEGHTSDNIVVYLPEHNLLFGVCFIKSTEATDLGNVADANLKTWRQSVQNVIDAFPEAKLVVPGHQHWGDKSALNHTQNLLKNH